jgi:hypothetical protein
MDYDIDFERSFVHTDWLDQVDRVSAGGDNGFNARFHLLESDLDVLGDRVARINTALNTVRGEIHAGVGIMAGDGAGATPDGASGFLVFPVQAPNDILVRLGPGVVGGRSVAPRGAHRYSDQPWVDPAVAAAAGVPPIPSLTTPTGNRDDVVYVDTWEREGESGELVGEVAVRVAEGVAVPPAAAEGHAFLVIAVLHRKAGVAQVAAADIEDRRVFVDRSPAVRTLTLPPTLTPESAHAVWTFIGLGAQADNGNGLVRGWLPVVLPHRSRLLSLRYGGRHSGTGHNTQLMLIRYALGGAAAGTEEGVTVLATDTVTASGQFARTVAIDGDGADLVDNVQFGYALLAQDHPGTSHTILYAVTFTYLA